MSTSKKLNEFPCKSCGAKSFKTPIVVGRGKVSSKVMIVGEAPGAKEEKMSIPFVGRSGKLLDNLFQMHGFDLENDVYFCNVIKTRPPNNRLPTKEEVSFHLPWLYKQIKLVDPLIIILVGSTALRALLGISSKITEVRGTWHNWEGINVMPIFHPSYLLRNPSKESGKPYDLTCLDFLEISKKLKELKIVHTHSNLFIPTSG